MDLNLYKLSDIYILGLLSCPVTLVLKGNILQTLAALAKSKETATILWNILETSQIIPTIPVISSNSKYYTKYYNSLNF